MLEKANPEAGTIRYSIDNDDGRFALDLSNNPKLKDVSALEGLPLSSLDLSNTAVNDIGPMKGMPLETLHIDGTVIRDLNVLEGMPLATITAEGAPVENVVFVKEMLTLVNYRFGKSSREKKSKVGSPRPGRRYVNSIGMRMQPMRYDRRRMLSIWETRVEDFRKFVEATGHRVDPGLYMVDAHQWKKFALSWDSPGFEQAPDHPVVGVSARDADKYCEWLTETELAEGILAEGDHYRLPTSGEWEKAAGQHHMMSRPFAWGTSWPPDDDSANLGGREVLTFITSASILDKIPGTRPILVPGYTDRFRYTSPVGHFHSTGPFRDLGGNVREWCSDTVIRTEDEKEFEYRIVRGAAWMVMGNDKPHRLYQLNRVSHESPESRYANLGFRVMLELAEPEQLDDAPFATAAEQ